MSDPAQPMSDDDTAAFLAAVEAGLADATAGRTVPHDECGAGCYLGARRVSCPRLNARKLHAHGAQ